MKVMFISDIHGGYEDLGKVLKIFKEETFDKLFILGDIYCTDPQNNYNVSALLASIKNGVAIRGNCDVMLTKIPDSYRTEIDGIRILLIHDENKVANDSDIDVVLCGHTHKPNIEYKNNTYYINPGSIHNSREGENSFGVLDHGKVYIKSINNVLRAEVEIKGKRKQYD